MAFCPNCGSRIDDDKVGCQGCGYKSMIEGEQIGVANAGVSLNKSEEASDTIIANTQNQAFTQEASASQAQSNVDNGRTQGQNFSPKQENNGTYNAPPIYTNQASNQNADHAQQEEKLSTLMKVLIIVGTVFVPLVGIIVGVIFMNKGYGETPKFGKTLLICTLIYIIAYFLCCCVGWTFMMGVGGLSNWYY